MSTLSLLLAWSALVLVAVVSPGPDTLLVAGHAARNGLRTGLAAVAGILTGGLWYMALLGFGLLSLLTASPLIFAIVKTAGALYLAWLGAKLLIGALRRRIEAKPEAASLALAAPYRQGLVTNVFNPKIALFYLAVLPQFIGSGANAPLFGALLIAIHYAIGGVWLSIVAFGASRAGGAVRAGNTMRWIEGVLGAAFIGLAGKLVISRS